MGLGQEAELQQLTAQELQVQGGGPVSDDKVTAIEEDARHHPVLTTCTDMGKCTHMCTHTESLVRRLMHVRSEPTDPSVLCPPFLPPPL